MSLAAIALVLVALVQEDWKPPENPDPSQILREAQADARAQKYESALAKHVWYHHNALKHQPAQTGVRRSFALSYWKQLADSYPPALLKMVEIREAAAAKVTAGQDVRESFADFAAFNRYLDAETQTKDLFLSLHAQQPESAKQVFRLARPALIKAKEYKLCGEYLAADQMQGVIASFRRGKQSAEKSQFGAKLVDFQNNQFTNDAATLVAILAVNGRSADADKVAQEAKKEWDDPAFQRAIDSALAGKVPDPWP